jgi:hypothetical protein
VAAIAGSSIAQGARGPRPPCRRSVDAVAAGVCTASSPAVWLVAARWGACFTARDGEAAHACLLHAWC